MRFFCHVGYMLLFFKIILHFPLFFISFGYTVCSSPNKTESVEPIQCFCCSVQFLPLTVTSVFQFTFPKARVCLVQSNSSTLPLGQIGFVFLSFPPFYLFCSIFFFSLGFHLWQMSYSWGGRFCLHMWLLLQGVGGVFDTMFILPSVHNLHPFFKTGNNPKPESQSIVSLPPFPLPNFIYL